jgi:hypothetical protein
VAEDRDIPDAIRGVFLARCHSEPSGSSMIIPLH